jgi:phosphatidylserine/phosphatidylglycerophosphate/cardiolipin synthase-like enzyme
LDNSDLVRVLPFALAASLACGGSNDPQTDALEIVGGASIRTFFSNPGETSTNTDTSINDEVTALVKGAPPGSTLRAGIHEWGYVPLDEAMREAAQRGVDVYVTMKFHPPGYPGHDMLVKDQQDFPEHFHYVRCGSSVSQAACISPAAGGYSHTKLFTFSRTKIGDAYADNVHFNTSGNQGTAGMSQFNNAVLVANAPESYRAWTDYLSHMFEQAPKSSDIYNSPASPAGHFADPAAKMEGYLFPRGDGKDTIAEALKGIVDPFDAQTNPCELRVAAANFSDGRPAVRNELLRIADTLRCKVYVAYTNLSEGYYTDFNDRARHSTIEVQRLKRRLAPGKPCIYIHSKYFIYKGRYEGSSSQRKLVWMGSHNFEGGSLTKTDEVMERLEDDPTYAAYEKNYAKIWYFAQVNLGGSTPTTCD